MASNSETGHGINVNNFKLVIDKITAIGAGYNTSNPDIKIPNMTTVWTAADTAHQAILTIAPTTKNPINNREIIFEPTDKLVTRMLAMYNSSKATDQAKADAKGLADRFRGSNVKVDTLPNGTPDPNSVSNSHLGFIQKQESFKQLVELLKADPTNYNPNEADLKTTVLTTLAASMKTANDGIGAILAPLEVARTTRNKALYTEKTGIVDLAQTCKEYLKGAFGASSPEYKMVNSIKFTRPKKK